MCCGPGDHSQDDEMRNIDLYRLRALKKAVIMAQDAIDKNLFCGTDGAIIVLKKALLRAEKRWIKVGERLGA